jgi:hypothetical protein
MATETTTQIVREAPEIEKIRLQLLEAAKAQTQAPMTLPGYQVAGFTPDQVAALQRGVQGIGAYQPFMQQGTQAVSSGMGALGESADILRGSDTRGQFAAAQQAMNLAAQPAAALGNLANVAGAGMGLIGQGAQGIERAQQLAEQGAAANLQPSQATLGMGIGSVLGSMGQFDPRSTQAFMNPYQQQVIDESLRQIQRQGDISRQNLQAQAVRSGAFGGSREGVQRAELDRALAEQQNAAILGGLQQGYGQSQQQAMQAFEAQQGRAQQGAGLFGNLGSTLGQQALQEAQLRQGAAGLTGQLGGQQAQLAGLYGNVAGQQANILGQQSQLQQGIGQGIGALAGQQFGIGSQMAAGLGSLGTQLGNLGVQQGAMGQTAQQLGQSDVGFLFNLGQQQQRQQQSVLDAERATAMQTAMQPMQNIAFLSDIYKGAPSTQMSMTQQATPSPSPFQQIAGLATGALATAGAAKTAGLI